jgi:adenylate cyclase
VSAFRLEQIGGILRFTVAPGRALVLGRSPQCDLIVADQSVSRRHAELFVQDAGVTVRDLGSANGTLVNGERVTSGRAADRDVLAFGGIAFRVQARAAGGSLSEDLPGGMTLRALALPLTAGHDRNARVLARLLEVSAGLSGDTSLETLLDTVVELAFEQVDADRVGLLLASAAPAELELAAWRNRVGDAAPRVPRTIAERAVAERGPVLTASAVDDARFQTGSVVVQAVRSAMCVPLLDTDARVLGALYADTISRPEPFDDDEARTLLAFGGLAAVAIARARYADEARRAREVRATFERFFAPGVAAAIAEAGEQVALGGRRLPVAVLFSDIRGFTALAGVMPPEEIAALLGEYFAVAVDAVFEHGGTLDKFIGDAVMAVWGAPLPVEDPVDRALAAALAIRREVAGLNARRETTGRPAVELGIGIAWGEVFAGNVGTDRRLEYTVVGDAVNLCAHLADAAGPGEILVAGDAARQLTHRPKLDSMPALDLKGRTLEVFRV